MANVKDIPESLWAKIAEMFAADDEADEALQHDEMDDEEEGRLDYLTGFHYRAGWVQGIVEALNVDGGRDALYAEHKRRMAGQ